MSDATTILAELKTALATISGMTVRTDLAATETTSAVLPVMTLWSTADARMDGQGYGALAYTRTVIIEAKMAATSTYGAALDALLTAVRTLISPSGLSQNFGKALDIREQEVRFFHPAPDSQVAIVQITLAIDYLERF